MKKHRWKIIPLLLLVTGLAIALVCSLFVISDLGWYGLGLLGGLLIAAVSVIGLRRQLTNDELAIAEQKAAANERLAELQEQESQLKATRKGVENELQQIADRVQRREQALADRLTTYHEWMEFPQPLDLTDERAIMSDPDLRALAEKDRQLHALLAEESKQVFEDISSNKYSVDGVVSVELIREDVLDLIVRVARIYQPDADNPLLETSIANVFRAVSRACLQFLVVLEELPVDVKELSLQSMYRWVRRAVQAYGLYRSTEPWWPYVSTAWYLGRFALGANPISLGAWWVVGSLSQRGAKVVAKRIVDRQALDLLNNLIRVIGYEVASVYSIDFRYRDANWIYATELTDLVSRFPVSRESLSHSLKEIGALQLRSEFGRIYLYRCLAEHRSANPEKYRAYAFLHPEEKAAVAARLEKFLHAFVAGNENRHVAKWREEIEARLGVRLKEAKAGRNTIAEEAEDAARSLASYLIAVKECEPAVMAEYLAPLSVMSLLDDEETALAAADISERAPQFFERPDLDPAGKVAGLYLNDLAQLAVRTPPHSQQGDEVLMDAAAWLRHDAQAMQKRLIQARSELLADLLPQDAPAKKFPPDVTRAILALLGGEQQPQFVYGKVTLQQPAPEGKPIIGWLVGFDDRMVMFTITGEPQVVWRSEGPVTITKSKGLISSAAQISGGVCLADETFEQPLLSVAGPTMIGFDKYFAPLFAASVPAT
ncbi:MAG: hypothetical protein NXI22_06205 [bacterium]|nr:hypothetical protein [bacterium]